MKAVLRERGGKHSLFHAAKNGMLEMVAELVEEGSDVNQQDRVSLATTLLCSERMQCVCASWPPV